ncbi:MAG TPA: 2-isopropylmalate synthase [Vicinamibacterales bacterium]|jgi:2-isopropylmalate synthase|nr:2-isopropylmalate synthase [Vicinamibacterales bacterium]
MAQHVRIFDTTLRDGEQAPGFSLRVSEKLRLARQLDALGVDIIEAGFPIASPADAEAVHRIAQEVRRPIIACLARCHPADLEKAAEAIKPAERGRIHTFIATSDLHLKAKLRMSREECLEAAIQAVRFARHHTYDVQFSAEDATRSDLDFLCRVVEAVVKAGANTINLPDTVGYATPDEMREFFTTIRSRVPNSDKVIFSTHCHDDLGLAVANSLAAVQGGAQQVECTVNGIGERAGNASLEEIVMAFTVRQERLPYSTSISTRELYPSSEMLTRLTGERVQANKAIVGRNAFAHEAGIHQDGMMKDRRTYEIMRAEDVGAPWNPLVLGKHSGRHAVQRRCTELGLQIDADELIEIYRALMTIADDRKLITDNDVVAVVSAVRTGTSRHEPVDPFDTPPGVTAAHHPTGYGHGV